MNLSRNLLSLLLCALCLGGCSERHDLHDEKDLEAVFKSEFGEPPGTRFSVKEYRYQFIREVTTYWMSFAGTDKEVDLLMKKAGWRHIRDVDNQHAGFRLTDSFSQRNARAPDWWPQIVEKQNQNRDFFVYESKSEVTVTGKILWYDEVNKVAYLYSKTW